MSFPTLEDALKSSPKLSKTDLEYIQDWMSKQPHLPRMKGIELVSFLVRSEFSLERTKEALDKYLTMRTHAPEVFKYRELQPIKDQLRFFHVSLMGKDTEGNRIVCLGISNEDISQGFDTEICSFLALSFMEVCVRNDPTTSGYVFVADAQYLTTGHLMRTSVTMIKKLVTFIAEGTPAKIVAFHIINVNSVVDKIWLLVKPFLSDEVQKKVNIHSKNLDEFYSKVPQDMLPQEFGGPLRSTKEYYSELAALLEAHEPWLQTLDERVVDESRRPGRARGEADVFGVEGSFKTLQVD